MTTITIRIDVPDGATVRVIDGGTEDDFEHEPLPDPSRYGPEQTEPLPPVQVHRTVAQPAQQGPTWEAGQVHEQGHKPLKAGAKGGLFCPTKMRDGSWCQWRAA